MRSGDLNKRVTIQYPAKTRTTTGGYSETWTDLVTVWAAIWPVSAAERIQSAQNTMEVTHRIRIRYRSKLSPEWRIKYGTRYFAISGIINPQEKNEWLDLVCKEVK